MLAPEPGDLRAPARASDAIPSRADSASIERYAWLTRGSRSVTGAGRRSVRKYPPVRHRRREIGALMGGAAAGSSGLSSQ
jgi:hypothetical protein